MCSRQGFGRCLAFASRISAVCLLVNGACHPATEPEAPPVWQTEEIETRLAAVRRDNAAMLALETSAIAPLEPTDWQLAVRLPDQPVLETAIGLDPLFAAGAVEFEILLEIETSIRVFHRVLPASMAGQWHPIELDLSSLHSAARRGRVHFVRRYLPGVGTTAPSSIAPLQLAFWRAPQIRSRRLPKRPNLILFSLDALRADHLGFMGYQRATSPNIDRIAAEGLTFRQTVSQAPWTTPSHFSMLTGMYPRNHGAMRLERRPRANTAPMLSALLRQQGYLTAAFTGRGLISAVYGFYEGFDFYNETEGTGQCSTDVEPIVANASSWLRRHRDRTFFLFVHSYEPHAPFCGNPDFVDAEALDPSRVSEIDLRTAYYDGNIKKADRFVAKLIETIHDVGLWEDSVVVITSDHGTDLGGRNPPEAVLQVGHGYNLYDEALRVPLIVTGGAVRDRPGTIDAQVRLVDLMPTLLELLGVEPPTRLDGRSLLSLLIHREADRPALSEGVCYGSARVSLRRPPYKYIRRIAPGLIDHSNSKGLPVTPLDELYNLTRDPGERVNIAGQAPAHVHRLRQELEALAGGHLVPQASVAGAEPDLGPEEALRALGYLQ